MKHLHELKEKLCDELEKLSKKRELSMPDLDMAYKLTSTVKNITKIEMAEESGGYSNDGMWRADGEYSHGYSDRRRDRMGRYTRDGEDYSMRGGYSRNSYSMGDQFMEEVEDKLRRESDPMVKDALKQLANAMRK